MKSCLINKLSLLFLIAITGIYCSPRLAPDSGWGYQRWVLTEMKGVPVQLSGGARDAYVEFFPTDKRFTGNGGCNRISGNYELEKRADIEFKDVVSTKMACPDISFENTFLTTLGTVDRYEVRENEMLLKDGKKTVLVLQRRTERF